MKRFLRENGLSIVLFALFLGCQIGLSFVGLRHENAELADHGQAAIGYGAYVTSGGFLEATMENWESEFLQMFAYVILTAILFQKGSAESKAPDEDEEVDHDPRLARNPDRPWPVKKGGLVLRIYEHSLSIALFLLFAVSFHLHAVGGAIDYSEEQLLHGGAAVSTLQYYGTSRFWFESLQNWQSEFFSVGMIIVLTIWLRQRGSPESKPVAAGHSKSGH
ncbi:MAG TPA: DUF6766 family protein [Gemmatimonadales bacterium]|nr:DUF6766 family protein [Gemmatimonadales bacterium]